MHIALTLVGAYLFVQVAIVIWIFCFVFLSLLYVFFIARTFLSSC